MSPCRPRWTERGATSAFTSDDPPSLLLPLLGARWPSGCPVPFVVRGVVIFGQIISLFLDKSSPFFRLAERNKGQFFCDQKNQNSWGCPGSGASARTRVFASFDCKRGMFGSFHLKRIEINLLTNKSNRLCIKNPLFIRGDKHGARVRASRDDSNPHP